jgi:hypothetical protein
MYGVPANLDFSQYLNTTCIQIALGEFQIQLHFHPDATISIEGRWELRDGHRQIIDQSVDNEAREAYRLHSLLGQSVVDSTLSAPASFSLTFANGHVLEIFDDSQKYESCQLSPSGVII